MESQRTLRTKKSSKQSKTLRFIRISGLIFIRFLRFSLFKLREHGIQGRENAQIYANKPECHSNGQNFGSVRLYDCFAAWLILGYGFTASLVIFMVEHFIKLKKRCLVQPIQ